MDTLTFLKLALKELPKIDLSQLPDDPIGYAEASFIKVPLYGELLGCETVVFNSFNDITKKLNAKLNLISSEVKKIHGCKRADIISEVIESLSVNGLYSKLKQGDIKPFSPVGLEEIIALMGSKEYAPATLVFNDGDDSLRTLAYELDLEHVQGESVEEKVKFIGLKIPFVADYSLEVIDINDILSRFPGVYAEYESFLYANTENALLLILLYTRLGITHDVLGNLRVSDIERLRKAVETEIKKEPKPKSNSAKKRSNEKAEVESEDTKSSSADSGRQLDVQDESDPEAG